MPIYQYQVINERNRGIFEVEQKINECPPLTTHPITNEPVKRILTAAFPIAYSSHRERKSHFPLINLHKNGFTQYEKDSVSGDYYKTVGNQRDLKRSLPMKLKHPGK